MTFRATAQGRGGSCHRVVGASGALTGYRWGVERKRLLLEAERRGRATPDEETARPCS
jgi:hypothetical protein